MTAPPASLAQPGKAMMTDESVLEWATGWLRENTEADPTFRQRFLDSLLHELAARRAEERVRIIAWLQSEDARQYTEVGPLIAKAIEEGRHLSLAQQARRGGAR